jgi:hypothetical protein
LRAAVLTEFGQALELLDLPILGPEADEALIKVMATDICGTDLKIVAGAFTTTVLPIVPGHEVAGELVETSMGLHKASALRATYTILAVGAEFAKPISQRCVLHHVELASRGTVDLPPSVWTR